MAFTKIPLSFSALNAGYPDNQSLPPLITTWLREQHVKEQEHNDNLDAINDQHRANGEPLEGKQWSTSCCMQVSVAFNKAGASIPGHSFRRANLLADFGFNILAVDEFFNYLSCKYGPTDTFTQFSDVQGMAGVVVMGRQHIELFDGEFILQSAKGLAQYKRSSQAVMSPGFIEGARPYYFWQLTGDAPSQNASAGGAVPDWLVGWWTVYDGQYYYYYFFGDGTVVYIEQVPNKTWTPPKTIHNRGVCVKNDKVHGYTVTWNPIAGETTSTIEDFTPLGWTSQTEMNAVSNKYSPIYAKKMGNIAGS